MLEDDFSLREAIVAIEIPVVEVHLSNIDVRARFHQKSFISAVGKGKIKGFGWQSYTLGLRALVEFINVSDNLITLVSRGFSE